MSALLNLTASCQIAAQHVSPVDGNPTTVFVQLGDDGVVLTVEQAGQLHAALGKALAPPADEAGKSFRSSG